MTVDETVEAAQADYFWAPDDVTVVARPDITYAWADRPQVVYNTVVRARPALAEPRRLVAEVLARHGDRASRWSLNPLSDTPALRAALEAAGYREGNRHHAYVIDPDAYSHAPASRVDVRQVASVGDLRDLYEVASEVFGAAGERSEADLAAELVACTHPGTRIARFVARIGGVPVGSAGMTCFADLDFAFIWAGGVRAAWRGRGVYTALLRARMDRARAWGLGLVGLYARDTTSGPIVAAQGFARHGRYVQWDRPARADR